MTNFYRHYNSNRAPLGLFFHATWFSNKKNRWAFRKFLDEMVARPDTYLVSTWEVIQWMRNPTPQSQVNLCWISQSLNNFGLLPQLLVYYKHFKLDISRIICSQFHCLVQGPKKGLTDALSAVGFCLGSGLFGSYNSD